MKFHLLTAIALAAANTLPAHAALTNNAGTIAAPIAVVDFEAYDGLLTSGPVWVAADVTFTGDAGSELGAYVRDFGDNGAWGAGNHFAVDALSGWAVVVSAYGDNNQVIETHPMTVDTAFDSYNQGSFLGITRGQADIRSISFKGVGVVMDNFTYTTPVPEPESYALMLAGLAALGLLARRRA